MAIFIELDHFGVKTSVNIDKVSSIEPRRLEKGTSIFIPGLPDSPISFSETYEEVMKKIEQKKHEERYLIALENAMQMRIVNNQG